MAFLKPELWNHASLVQLVQLPHFLQEMQGIEETSLSEFSRLEAQIYFSQPSLTYQLESSKFFFPEAKTRNHAGQPATVGFYPKMHPN